MHPVSSPHGMPFYSKLKWGPVLNKQKAGEGRTPRKDPEPPSKPYDCCCQGLGYDGTLRCRQFFGILRTHFYNLIGSFFRAMTRDLKGVLKQ